MDSKKAINILSKERKNLNKRYLKAIMNQKQDLGSNLLARVKAHDYAIIVLLILNGET